jgi:hypothetical protein
VTTALAITIVDARPSSQTAIPGITFRLRIENLSGARVHAMVLRCQVRIEPRRRQYSISEQMRLSELFGDATQWERALRGVGWAHTALAVPSFERDINVELHVDCTYDLEVAVGKYLHAIRDSDVPLLFLFGGTIFSTGPSGGMSIAPVSGNLDAMFRMPAKVWHSAMDQFFPGGGWVRLQRETIDRLQAFRGREAVVSWDDAIERLLDHFMPEEVA